MIFQSRIKSARLISLIGMLGLPLSACSGSWTRRTANCVPQLTFESSEEMVFVIIIDDQGASGYSRLRRRKNEQFLSIVLMNSNIVLDPRQSFGGLGFEFLELPKGTKLHLDGSMARVTPTGLGRIFDNIETFFFRAEVDKYTVWVPITPFFILSDQATDAATRDILVALGFLEPGTFVSVPISDWRCPQ